MNRIFAIILLSLTIGMATGCTDERRLGGMATGGAGTLTNIVVNVPREAWQYSGMPDNNYFFATVKMPEITSTVYKKGLVKMYRSYDIDNENSTQMELPYVRLNEYIYGDNQKGFYTETVDYEFGVGNMSIYYTASDFDYEDDHSFVPEAMQFRCVILY